MRPEIHAHVVQFDNAATMTIGDVMKAISAAQDGDEASAIKAAYLRRIHRDQPTYSAATAEDVALQNIGYFTGYLDQAEGARILKLYAGAYHPVFGSRHVEGKVTPEEAFEAGRKLGEASRARA